MHWIQSERDVPPLIKYTSNHSSICEPWNILDLQVQHFFLRIDGRVSSLMASMLLQMSQQSKAMGKKDVSLETRSAMKFAYKRKTIVILSRLCERIHSFENYGVIHNELVSR